MQKYLKPPQALKNLLSPQLTSVKPLSVTCLVAVEVGWDVLCLSFATSVWSCTHGRLRRIHWEIWASSKSLMVFRAVWERKGRNEDIIWLLYQRVQPGCGFTAVKRRFSLCWLCCWNVSRCLKEEKQPGCCVGCSLSLQWLVFSQFSFIPSKFGGVFGSILSLIPLRYFEWKHIKQSAMKYLGGWPYGLRSQWGVLLTEIVSGGQRGVPQNNLYSFPLAGTGLGDVSNLNDTFPHHTHCSFLVKIQIKF